MLIEFVSNGLVNIH